MGDPAKISASVVQPRECRIVWPSESDICERKKQTKIVRSDTGKYIGSNSVLSEVSVPAARKAITKKNFAYFVVAVVQDKQAKKMVTRERNITADSVISALSAKSSAGSRLKSIAAASAGPIRKILLAMK
jgi:hypothetical protein